MRRLGPDGWSGLVMLVVSAGVGLPVLLGLVDPRISMVAWTSAFVAVFAAILVTVFSPRRKIRLTAYAAAVLLSWVVLLGASGAGLLPILLVVIAALGPEFIRLPANLVVVALNTLVIGLHTIGDGWLEPLIMAGFYALIQIASVLSVQAILREQRLRRELAEAHVDLQAATVLLESTARTAERLRISRELHDLVGHQLTVLTLELEAARHREGPAARPHVERAGEVARSLLSDVRATVGQMREQPATDLRAALERVARDVPGLDVDLVVDDDLTVDDDQAAALVRAVQEVVTNALRHAEAQELWVRVERDGTRVHLSAADDGRGAPEISPGNGLRGLAERFEALGGGVEYDGTRGFRVRAWVPAR
ncbi:two-component sensor histidine kinase [Aeromicrobium camelliae]|uniref:Two-component sensor histidine kinase n=1 Tax=Aeromicrobium camelliae TaxID=1538144 RepID=A0A3N6X6W2_9ACTN|nr:histidine kinase [Aeromicrobium camelliae]RQN09388.1 two-component sensor histidine kinase [Aeromicrobium camelliae]